MATGYDDHTALLWAAQGCRATLPAVMASILRCCGRRRAAGLYSLWLWRLHYAAVGDAGLQGSIACSHGDYAALLWAAQGCRASLPAAMVSTLCCCGRRRAAGLHCLWPWRVHCAAVGGAGLQGFIACGHGECTALMWAAQGCKAALPAAMATTLRCCGRRRAAGRHRLQLWRLHYAAVGGAGLRGSIACSHGDYAALL